MSRTHIITDRIPYFPSVTIAALPNACDVIINRLWRLWRPQHNVNRASETRGRFVRTPWPHKQLPDDWHNKLIHCSPWLKSLQWRHNRHDGVSNHQPDYCLLQRLLRRKSKKTSKLRVTGLREGNVPVTGEFPAVTRKMFPFGDVVLMT